jgi:DNA-binding LacI/PurR family transcriptional regulator
VRGIQQGLCDGFYNNNTTLLTNFGNLQRDMCTGFSSVAQGFDTVNQNLADNRYAMQNCCCETQRAIDGVRFDNSQNTCAITNAIHQEGETTRALINANTMQELRDRLDAKNTELLGANFQLSQCAQNQYLVNQLRPTPIPAFPATNLYGSSGTCGCCG